MFINLPKQQNILSVDNQRQFYTLIDEDDTHLTYKVCYSIDVISAIRANGIKVKITASSLQQLALNPDDTVLNASSIESKVRTARSERKSAIRNKQKNILTEVIRNSDLELDPNLFFQVKNFLDDEDRDLPRINGIVKDNNVLKLIKNKTVLSRIKNIDDRNKIEAVLDSNVITEEETRSLTGIPKPAFFTRLIMQSSIDPATVADLNNSIVTYANAIDGTQAKKQEESRSSKLSFLKKIVTLNDEPVNDSKQITKEDLRIPVRKKVLDNLRLYSQLIKIKKESLKNNKFELKIELINRDNVTIDTIAQAVKVDNSNITINKALSPPNISVKKLREGKVRITLSQNDVNAEGISVFQKIIRSSQADLKKNSYEFLGSYKVKKENDFFIKDVETDTHNPTVYRAFSYDKEGNNSLLFSSKVLNSQKNISLFGSAIEARISEEGISVEINEYPATAISVGVLRRDTTLNEKHFSLITPIGEQIRLTGDTLNKTFIDTRVKNNHVYEYAAKFFYKNGDNKQSGTAAIEYMPLSKTKTFTRLEVTDTGATEQGLDFSFSMITEIPEEDLDLIKLLLEKNGISEFFEDVQLSERDRFRDILAYNVTRTNLTTGQKETFGNISQPQFSDRTNGEAAGASMLEYGNVYRYEVRTLLRVPETLFEKFEKDSTDRNGNSYTYLPFKFKHPVVTKYGNIPTKDSLISNYAKTQMDFGDIGDSVELLFSLKQSMPTVGDCTVNLINDDTAVIAWNINGDVSLIDHFLIIRQANNSRSIIEKVHSNINSSDFNFFYKLTRDDIGEMSFRILPIYNDYSFGIESVTNLIAYNE
jgi:hypothetical protein